MVPLNRRVSARSSVAFVNVPLTILWWEPGRAEQTQLTHPISQPPSVSSQLVLFFYLSVLVLLLVSTADLHWQWAWWVTCVGSMCPPPPHPFPSWQRAESAVFTASIEFPITARQTVQLGAVNNYSLSQVLHSTAGRSGKSQWPHAIQFWTHVWAERTLIGTLLVA